MSENETVKNFDFGAPATEGPKVIGEFTLAGQEKPFLIRELVDTHVAYLVRAAQRKRNETAIIAAVLNFMEYALVAESADRFEEIVLGDPGLTMMQVVDVFRYVLEVVSDGADTGEGVEVKKPRSRSGNPAVRSA